MNPKSPLCIGCPMFDIGEGFVGPAGRCSNGTLIVGEAPGAEEVEQGVPFVGPSGRVLERVLTTGRLNREDYGITNVIQCQAPNNDISAVPPAAIVHCKVHRDAAVAHFAPKRIIALGDTAFSTLTGQSGISEKRGYHYEAKDYPGIPVIGTFHPAYLMYDRKKARSQSKGKAGMSLMQAVLFDIKVAPTIPRESPAISADIAAKDFEEALPRMASAPWIACDIETPTSANIDDEDLDIIDPSYTITYCSLAYAREGRADRPSPEVHAFSYPWQEPYISLTRQALAGENNKLFWNYLFDVPRLEANGMAVNGQIVDVMWLWHFLFSDLSRRLGSAAPFFLGIPEWKSSKDENLAYYNAMDSWATGRIYQEIHKLARERGVESIMHRHVTLLLGVLRKMSARGVSIDLEALDRFRTALQDKLHALSAELDGLWPASMRKVHPKEGYKRTPSTRAICPACHGVGKAAAPRHSRGGEADVPLGASAPKSLQQKRRGGPKCSRCDGKKFIQVEQTQGLMQRIFKEGSSEVARWCKPLPYNPLSPDDIKNYADACSHTVTPPKHGRPGRSLPSTEERHLAVLANRYHDRLYSGTIEYRGLNKLLGTYTNWPMSPTENPAIAKVHTRFTLAPATGRLSSTRPNVQNIPHDEDDPMAMEFRRIIVASPGNVLVRADYKGIEAVLTGWFSGDKEYMALALIGVHAWNTAHFLKLVVPPVLSPELPGFLKAVKRENPALYSKLKKVGHGINYGEGPFKIHDQNPGMFADRSEAKRLWMFIRSKISKVISWQDATVRAAATTKRIANPFGRPRWLFDIPGEDGPAAIAQQPQSTAADIIYEAMLAADGCWIGEYLVWQIHDELVLDVPMELALNAAAALQMIMERPIPELGGLAIGVDVKIGSTLLEGLSPAEWESRPIEKEEERSEYVRRFERVPLQ